MLPGEQVAVDGHGHVSGDSEGAPDGSGGGEVGGHLVEKVIGRHYAACKADKIGSLPNTHELRKRRKRVCVCEREKEERERREEERERREEESNFKQ